MQMTDFSDLIKKWKLVPNHHESVIRAYEIVRDIPYGSTGERDPKKIVKKNLGSCSGKHLLLSNLLKELGYENKIVTCFHYFEEVIPIQDDFPERLKYIIANRKVPDFHHFVKLKAKDRWLKLDATWDSALFKYGFRVNLDWKGDEDTLVAVNPIKFYPEDQDIITLKVKLISELPKDDLEIRAEFLKLLTDWLKSKR